MSRTGEHRGTEHDACLTPSPGHPAGVQQIAEGCRFSFVAGPDRLVLQSPVAFEEVDGRALAGFGVDAGQTLGFALRGSPSWQDAPPRLDTAAALAASEAAWRGWWLQRIGARPLSEAVARSLVVLKALTHRETGAAVAAPTTSLPEQLGGPRNWDYRYCWLRDAALAVSALHAAGFERELDDWTRWLGRALAGRTGAPQILYGIGGERRLDEYELPWLPGYERSAPVRVGNAASGQVQLDVYGEVLGALCLARHVGPQPEVGDAPAPQARRDGGSPDAAATWELASSLLAELEHLWEQPDDGLWEVRGGRRHFVHSKAMAWYAFDGGIRLAERDGLDAPLERWRDVRARLHAQVCERGFNHRKNTFVQAYDGEALDASLLWLPLIGFLPADDPRIVGTVAAIERELLREGLVLRYDPAEAADGLPGGEGAFLACSFWLVEAYAMQGRLTDARALYDRLLSYRNDLGLLAEELDPVTKRQLGNFPQAFSHLALVDAALRLDAVGAGRFPA